MTESTNEYKKRIEEIKQSIENEPYMAKMREDIAEGISKTGIRQANVEEQFQSVLDETTGKDVISAPELIAARNGKSNLKTRLDDEHAQVTAQLAQTGVEFETKRMHAFNSASDTNIPLEIHNFAGQAGSNDVSSEVTHHYTDAPAKVIDNVGTGTILTLSNSRNSVNRPDQPSDFVGSGKVLQYRRYNTAVSDYEIVMEITKDGNIVKTGKGSGTDTALKLTQSKDDDNLYGMTFENTKEHTFPFQFRNGGAFLTIITNAGKTMATIQSATRMTTGLELTAAAGDLHLKANAGTIKMSRDGAYHQALLSLSGSTANRPTTNLTIGLTYFDTTLGKPIWYKGGGVWVDAMSTNV